QASLVAPRGKLAVHALPDGSSITLDADSEMTVFYTANARRVQLLRGAAFFSVSKDAGKPFSVLAGEVTVVVTGTRFGVERHPGGVSVQVESGSVRVQSGSGSMVDLVAGDEVWIDTSGTPLRRRTPPDQFASWRNGELVFSETPLAEA